MAERRAAFHVVDEFEAALAEYTGAPHVVTTDSCTNALFLCCRWWCLRHGYVAVNLPKHTYVGVYPAVMRAGLGVKWADIPWKGSYRMEPTSIVDSAKRFHSGMYESGTLTCLSFQAGKILPIGRGGAILTDNAEAADWFRKARLDGRTAGVDYKENTYQTAGWHMYMTPPDAARGLWLLTYADDDEPNDYTEYPDLSKAEWV